MEKSPAYLSLAVLAIVAAVLLPRDRDSDQTPSSTSTKDSRPEKPETHQSSDAVDDDPFDALAVLAESLAFDLSPDNLRRMVVRETDIVHQRTDRPVTAERQKAAESFSQDFIRFATATDK